MKKIHLGILLGIVAGIIDVIPMVLQNLTWDANLSAFSLWVVSGVLIATTDIKMTESSGRSHDSGIMHRSESDATIKSVANGILIPFIVLLPSAIIIGWKEPFSLIPIFIMTLILGSMLGFLINKYGK